ncbi:MAG: hypothetical protein ACO1OD_12125 [Croceibacterium sp.]
MTLRSLLLAGCAALIAVPASALSDFRLPDTSTPTPSAPVVGPTDPDRPAPRPTPTPTPRPSPTPRPTLTPTPAPAITLPPAGQGAQARPTPRPVRTAAPTAGPSPTAAATDAATPTLPLPGETPFAAPTFAPAPASPAAEAAGEDGGWPWSWLAGLAGLLALLAGGGWWLRRRMLPGGTVLLVPDIEKPRVPEPSPEPEPAPEPALAAAPRATHPLAIAIEPLKLTQSVMNATLSYRLSLTNQGEAPLEGVTVAADLVAAHASLPREALTAALDTDLPERHAVPSLAPGERVELKGELRLPLSKAMPIRQGAAVVFVPLARFRAGAAGAEPRCFTLVVGQPSPRGAIQPHRLDLGPRSAEGLTGHAF